MKRNWAIGVLAGAALLSAGCASSEEAPKAGSEAPVSREADQARDKPTTRKASTKGSKKKKKVDPTPYEAKVTDRFKTSFVIKDAALFVPEVSLFGGQSGDRSKTLNVKHGAALVEVPFKRIEKLEVATGAESKAAKVKRGRLLVTLTLSPPKPKKPLKEGAKPKRPKPLKGTIKSNIELRGFFPSKLKASVRLNEVRTLVLKATPPTKKK